MLSLGLYIAFTLYISILLTIGIFARLSPTSSDFSLGGRTTNYYITAIAAHASDMSAWLFMGFPAAIYMHGLASSWIAVGLISGMLLSWHYIAYPLRLMTDQYDAYTIAELLSTHFKDKKKYISYVSSFILILFFLVYIAAGLTGLGCVFEEVFSIHYLTGITIGLTISILYVLLGGFIAVAWTHFFQGLFLLCMIALVPII